MNIDLEKLYYNMVECKAEWLYTLPQWNDILPEDKRKELYKKQKNSGTNHNENRKSSEETIHVHVVPAKNISSAADAN